MCDRRLIEADRAVIGTWLKLDVPETVELAAAAGLDFVIIDLEHSLIGTAGLSAMLALANALGVRALVRVPGRPGELAKVVLDHGAAGLVVPNVGSAEEARSIVAQAKFPPDGRRGLSTSARSGRWGLTDQFEYMATQDRSTTIFAQIESPRAVHEAARIAGVSGIDGLLAGPADLAANAASAPNGTVDLLLAELERTCAENDIFLGTAAGADPAEGRRLVDRGYRLLAMSSDTVLLRAAMAGLRTSLGTTVEA
jgi:2-keto-3-deoxy-L-rhamnonate aldolase RhmA